MSDCSCDQQRLSGSGGFFKDEDLNLETTPSWSCSLELPGLFRDGLKEDDIEKK
jgi:hypothetical protein